MEDNCIVCNLPKPKRNKQFCSYECAGLSKQNYKVCVVCKQSFKCSPTDEIRCCSPKCSKIHRQNMHKQGLYDSNLSRLLESKVEFQAKHKDEEHQNAKHWVIQSPDGTIYKFDNLMHFIRSNPDLIDGTTKQVYDGFVKVKAGKLGKRKRPAHTYKGWELLDWKD